MKEALLTALACLLALATAQANPTRYEWRSFGGVNVDLSPLFHWWEGAADRTNEMIDLTEMNSNKLDEVAALWTHLPIRPLPQWNRIKAKRISVAGAYWVLEAEIEPAPMMVRHERIYLANPPATEIQNFNWAKSRIAALEKARHSGASQAEAIQADKADAQAEYLQIVGLHTAYPDDSNLNRKVKDLKAQKKSADQKLANLSAARESYDQQIEALHSFLGTFPNPDHYELDHFAIRTGKTVNGCAVYELGSAQGLNY